jgi:hypothetical protein
MIKVRSIVAVAAGVAMLASCSSSSKASSSVGSPASTASTAGAPASSTAGSAPAPSISNAPVSAAGPLPAPCSLLTVADVAPLFGTTALDVKPAPGPQPGTAVCSFTLKVGVQGKEVDVKTHNDYANDPSYVLPTASATATAVSGLGDGAIVDTVNTGTRRITVKEGKNALEITVTFYTQPVDDAFVTHLATVAVGHL